MMYLFCFEVASIPEKLIYNFSKEEIISSLYHVLEEKGGHKIGAASQTISAMIASEQIADYLQIKRGGCNFKNAANYLF